MSGGQLPGLDAPSLSWGSPETLVGEEQGPVWGEVAGLGSGLLKLACEKAVVRGGAEFSGSRGQSCSTMGCADVSEGLTLGRPAAFAGPIRVHDRGPVLPLSQVVLETQPGSREQWVPLPRSLGPCPHHPPPSPCQAQHLPLPGLSQMGQGRVGLRASVPSLDFLPGKMAQGAGVPARPR